MCTTQVLSPTSPTPAAPPAPGWNVNLNNNGMPDPTATSSGGQQIPHAEGERSGRRRSHGRRRHHRHNHRERSGDDSSNPRPPRPSREHVMNQVDKILGSVASGNIVGIVDESMKIRTSEPTRKLVNGIMTTIFHPFDRLFGRSRPSQTTGISGNAT